MPFTHRRDTGRDQGCGNVLDAWTLRCGDGHPEMATGRAEGEARPLKPGSG